MKCIGGKTSPENTHNELRADGQTAISVPGINRGWHKIGLLWTAKKLVWSVDGVPKVQNSVLVPQVEMYLILSREANTDAKRRSKAQPHELVADGERIPYDPGLFGRNAVTPANREIMKKGPDEVRVRRVRAWKTSKK